jgi:hypothetical protein
MSAPRRPRHPAEMDVTTSQARDAKGSHNVTTQTFLAAGQCYADIAASPWRTDQHLTILKLVNRPGDVTAMVYRCFDGAILTVPASQLETAIATGVIVPVIATGRTATC